MGSLRYEIGQANSTSGANTISFDPTVFPGGQTITLAGSQLELSNTGRTQTITGPAGGVTVSGGGLSRVFQVDSGVTASLSGLTITGGSAGNGAGLSDYGTNLTMNGCVISGNSSSGGSLHLQQSVRQRHADRLHRQRQLRYRRRRRPGQQLRQPHR